MLGFMLEESGPVYRGIAYCGLDCGSCPALVATQSGDMEALAGVAARWSAEYGSEIAAESILCDGCKSGSRRINAFCAVCEIRACATGRGYSTCAPCEEYTCELLRGFAPFGSEGRANLDRIRKELEAGRS